MAKEAKDFPLGRSRYNWELWLNGSVWELQPGIDFTGKVASVRSAASNYAKRKGIRIRTKTSSDGRLYVQALGK